MGLSFFGGKFTAACLNAGTSSFADLVAACAPELLPGAGRRRRCSPASGRGPGTSPHGTTIVAAAFGGGVVMAGDRRATAGSMIAQRDIEKVFRSDDFSCVGIAGVAGIGLELVRLFQLELEHYEKLEGRTLSLEGKANRLAAFVRGNLGAAMQGLVVVPLFAGLRRGRRPGPDLQLRRDRRPVRGAPVPRRSGPGSVFARGALKKLYTDGLHARTTRCSLCMQALYDAADDDSATGGPDLTRQIYPVVAMVTADGFRRLSEERDRRVRAGRGGRADESPGGPVAPLRQA